MKNYTLSLSCRALLLFFALFYASSVSAQSQAFTTGTNIVSAGLGFNGVSGTGANNVLYHTVTPEYSFQYERGLWKAGPGVISLGVFLGEASYRYDVLYPLETSPTLEKWTYWEYGLRGAYHFTALKVPHLDTYAGIMISEQHTRYIAEMAPSLGSNSGGLSIFAGARYFFWSHLGIYAELATGPFFNGGIAATF
jgi:hypothetical protein